MALVDITATGEDNLLDRVKDIVEDELTYRDKQLLRLREEVLDLEDFDENISLTDFTLDDFRAELLRYIEAIPDFKRIRQSDSFKRFALKIAGLEL